MDTVTPLSVLAKLVPHAFVAVTVILPPLAPTIAMIAAVEDVPVHPVGNDQV